jgi:hypothetical protein
MTMRADTNHTGTANDPARRPGAAGWRRRFLPPQHGAWAMLAVPYFAGLFVVGYRWPDLPLAGAWIAAYLLSYYLFQAVKSRRPGRYRQQITLYGALAAPLAAVVVMSRPAVLWFAPAYATLSTVNAWYAWRRRERALLNNAASVVQSCLTIFVAATIAGATPRAALGAFLVCLAYFGGTVLYVKTMIRERGNPTYRRWSIGYHLIVFTVATWLSPWTAVLFGWLLIRAALLPARGWSPKRVGLLEIASCALLLACVVLL